MENSDLARFFTEIADLLEIKGADNFRIRSYRNAALSIEGHPESLRGLFESGGEKALTGIHGIGESIRAKVIEAITTGSCGYLEELKKELPAGVLDLLRVSGVGPKKAGLFFKELGIKGIDDLEAAAMAGLLKTLHGMGPVTEARILKSIQTIRTSTGKFKLSVAMQYADAFVTYLKRVPGVERVEPVGSLRRWKETVGDIDLLVISDDHLPVTSAFVAHPDVREVLAKGETRSSVILKTGLQVDIRVMEEKNFGAAFIYFTGSKAHNVELRERARRMGLKVNEYGVFDSDEKLVAGASEEDLYRALGLPLIIPELREGRGEIEAAVAGRLPRVVETSDIKGDLHVHTNESDGGDSLSEMAEAAIKLGYEYIAVTDHSKAVGVAHGLDEKRVVAQICAIEAYNERLKRRGVGFTVLKGAEVDIRADGTLDHPDSVLERLDCIVAAVHSGFQMKRDVMTGRIVKALETGRVNILAHPTGRLINERDGYEVDIEAVMEAAKKTGTALELNSYPDRLDLNDIHCLMAREKGILVAISTDAHSVSHYGNIRFGIHTAARGWLERKDVLNARPIKKLMEILKKG
ncbi:MAG: DNA polymerase/3'-5' exonuclease PolX [Deltaproteobacteria bacterium]